MRRFAVVAGLCLMFAAASAAAQTAPAGQSRPANPAPAAPAPAAPAQQAPAALPAAQPPRPFPEGAKVAYINTQRIAAESAEGKTASTRLKALNDKKVQELNDKQKQLQTAQSKLQAGESVLSDAARGQLEKDIEKLQVDIQRFTQDAQAEVQELNNELQAEFERKLRPIIAQVSQEKGLQIVFGPESGIVWADAGLDITPDVIKRFDNGAPAAGGAPK
jgi:Skp family chaperone for outer membrane proteins